MEITATKIEETEMNPAGYELKVPYTQTDDFGNTVTLYNKETIFNPQVLIDQKTLLEAQIVDIQNRLDAINKL